MLLSDKQILEFQQMYFDHFKKSISKSTAYDLAIKLIEFVGVVYQPLSEEDLKAVEASRQQIMKWRKEAYREALRKALEETEGKLRGPL